MQQQLSVKEKCDWLVDALRERKIDETRFNRELARVFIECKDDEDMSPMRYPKPPEVYSAYQKLADRDNSRNQQLLEQPEIKDYLEKQRRSLEHNKTKLLDFLRYKTRLYPEDTELRSICDSKIEDFRFSVNHPEMYLDDGHNAGSTETNVSSEAPF